MVDSPIILAALSLLMAAQANTGVIVDQHVHGVAFTRTDIESACGAHVIQIQYRNDWPRGIRGWVIFVRIDHEEVEGAAAGLQARAANRTVSKIEIMNCGFDERNPVIQGVMELSPLESRRDGLAPDVFFRLRRVGGSWGISWD